jgi:hypothetical protein
MHVLIHWGPSVLTVVESLLHTMAPQNIPTDTRCPQLPLTREQLFEHAWTSPIETLARELGLSGRGLGKLCARSQIPVPPRGYCAKKAADNCHPTEAAGVPGSLPTEDHVPADNGIRRTDRSCLAGAPARAL